MRLPDWLVSSRTRLDVTAGLVDGILNALTLAAGHLVKSGGGATLDLALRVGAATGLTTVFVFFVAHYAELRAELVQAEKELNLTYHGHLAASRLGRRAIQEAVTGALVAAGCGLVGSLVPLMLCALLPGNGIAGLSVTIGLLGMLGAVLARSFHGSSLFWASAVMVGGAILTYVGIKIDITG
jgi:predicted membrane protein (TIGR00267 family)